MHFRVIFVLPAGNLPSVGGSDEPEDKERDAEEEKLRQEAIKRAEEERRVKHKKFEDEREGIRQGIRDKVRRGGGLDYRGGKKWWVLGCVNITHL